MLLPNDRSRALMTMKPDRNLERTQLEQAKGMHPEQTFILNASAPSLDIPTSVMEAYEPSRVH